MVLINLLDKNKHSTWFPHRLVEFLWGALYCGMLLDGWEEYIVECIFLLNIDYDMLVLYVVKKILLHSFIWLFITGVAF